MEHLPHLERWQPSLWAKSRREQWMSSCKPHRFLSARSRSTQWDPEATDSSKPLCLQEQDLRPPWVSAVHTPGGPAVVCHAAEKTEVPRYWQQ